MKILHRNHVLDRQQLEAIAPTLLAYAMGQIKIEDVDELADRALENAGCPVHGAATPAPRIDSFRTHRVKNRTQPKAGDRRFLKGRGVEQIRQQVMHRFPGGGTRLAGVVSNGRPVWEWVDLGSERDRTSEAWKQARARGDR